MFADKEASKLPKPKKKTKKKNVVGLSEGVEVAGVKDGGEGDPGKRKRKRKKKDLGDKSEKKKKKKMKTDSTVGTTRLERKNIR